MTSQVELKHPWYNPVTPFVHYRTNPVFMVPAHLTLQQLSKIMLESSVTFKLRSAALPLAQQQSETLEQLFSKSAEDRKGFELQNCILDLEYEMNQLLSMAVEDQKDTQVEDPLAASEGGTGQAQISGYVPKMGLFEQFEE